MDALPFAESEVRGEPILLTVGPRSVPAYHARSVAPPRAGLVVATDIGGVRPLFTDMCDRLASHGLAVLAVEPFAQYPDVRDKPGPERLLDVARLRDDEQIADLAAGAAFLTEHDGVTKVSVLGFCMGGMYALKAAASGHFDGAMACYGMLRLPEDWRGEGQRDTLDVIADVCPTLAIFGSEDPWVPDDQIAELRALWTDRPGCEVVVVPNADHGFIHDPGRPTHRPGDAAAVWEKILQRAT